MGIAPEKAAELRVKHLEMVQAIVARMSNQAAALKNYCITLTTAVCGFAVTLQRPFVALLAVMPILIFWLLDAQYLRLERQFRSLFDHIRSENWEAIPNFEINRKHVRKERFLSAVVSWSIISFYGFLAGGVLIVAIIAGCIYGWTL